MVIQAPVIRALVIRTLVIWAPVIVCYFECYGYENLCADIHALLIRYAKLFVSNFIIIVINNVIITTNQVGLNA